MPKNPFKSKRKKKAKLTKGSVSDDESVGSLPSQIGFSDASSNIKQIPGQSTASKPRPVIAEHNDRDNDSVASIHTGNSVDPNIRKRAITEKNASSKHNLGSFYLGKQEWAKAQEYLLIALDARKEVFGKKDGHVAETEIKLAEIHVALKENDEAIKLLKKALASIKTLQMKPAEEEETKTDSTQKKLDLDGLAKSCIEMLENLGVNTSMLFLKEVPKESASRGDISDQEYEFLETTGSLSDPLVFLDILREQDLNQDQFMEGMNGLNNEILDKEIYYSYTDEEFSDVEIAAIISIGAQAIPYAEEPTYISDDSDESSDGQMSVDESPSVEDSVSSDEDSKSRKHNEMNNLLLGGVRQAMGQLELDAVKEMAQGSLMFTHGDIFGAEKFYKEHMEEWVDILGDENPSIISTKEDLGDIAFLIGHFYEAKQHYGEISLTTKRLHNGKPTHESVRLLEKLAMTNVKLNQPDTAEFLYNEAVDMADELKQNGSTTEEDALFHIASIYFKAGNYRMAKETSAKIILLLKHGEDEVNPKVYNLVGMIFFAEKKYNDAKFYFEKALQGSKKYPNFSKRFKVQILNNLGNSSNQVAQFMNAIGYFEQAVEEIESGKMSDFDKQTELICLYTNIGHSHFHQKNLDHAYEYYSKAYVIETQLFDEQTSESVRKLQSFIDATKSHRDDCEELFDENRESSETWKNYCCS
jgi:tetratricopeptide (TPR) repeat protein